MILAVEGVDGGLGLGVVLHLDEAEAAAPAGLAVAQDLGRPDAADIARTVLEKSSEVD